MGALPPDGVFSSLLLRNLPPARMSAAPIWESPWATGPGTAYTPRPSPFFFFLFSSLEQRFLISRRLFQNTSSPAWGGRSWSPRARDRRLLGDLSFVLETAAPTHRLPRRDVMQQNRSASAAAAESLHRLYHRKITEQCKQSNCAAALTCARRTRQIFVLPKWFYLFSETNHLPCVVGFLKARNETNQLQIGNVFIIFSYWHIYGFKNVIWQSIG